MKYMPLKKGDLVETRMDVTSFMTIKTVGKVSKVDNGIVELVDREGNKIGKFNESELKLR